MVQSQSNISMRPAGSAGAKNERFDLGLVDGQHLEFDYQELQAALAAWSPNKLGFFDHFVGAITDATADGISPLQFDISSTGTGAVASDALVVTTAATAADFGTVALGLHHTVSNGRAILDAKVKLDLLTSVQLEVGFSDAVSETAGLAFSDHTLAGVTDVATNAVVVAFDSGGETTLVVNSVNAGTPAAADTGVTPVADTYFTVRMILEADGTTYAYVNGTLTNTVSSAVATTAVLTPWLTVHALTTAARIMSVDYLSLAAAR